MKSFRFCCITIYNLQNRVLIKIEEDCSSGPQRSSDLEDRVMDKWPSCRQRAGMQAVGLGACEGQPWPSFQLWTQYEPLA